MYVQSDTNIFQVSTNYQISSIKHLSVTPQICLQICQNERTFSRNLILLVLTF